MNMFGFVQISQSRADLAHLVQTLQLQLFCVSAFGFEKLAWAVVGKYQAARSCDTFITPHRSATLNDRSRSRVSSRSRPCAADASPGAARRRIAGQGRGRVPESY